MNFIKEHINTYFKVPCLICQGVLDYNIYKKIWECLNCNKKFKNPQEKDSQII